MYLIDQIIKIDEKKIRKELNFFFIVNAVLTFCFFFWIIHMVIITREEDIFYYVKNDLSNIQKILIIYIFVKIMLIFVLLTILVEIDELHSWLALGYLCFFLYSLIYNLKLYEILFLPKAEHAIYYFFLIWLMYFYMFSIFFKIKKTWCLNFALMAIVIITFFLFFFLLVPYLDFSDFDFSYFGYV